MSSRTKRPDPDPKPSLRISHIVTGRRSNGNRVEYRVHPESDRYEIPEDVVLVRWRSRRHPDYTFSGSRLRPHVWRALAKALGTDCNAWPARMGEESLEATRNTWRDDPAFTVLRSSLPGAAVILALWEICGPAKLQQLIDRHTVGEVFGVPDLFLYASHKVGRQKLMGRFVEVKKPEEPLSPGQREEIAFMNRIGLHARCIRLIERDS